jgi:hypothetical protein
MKPEPVNRARVVVVRMEGTTDAIAAALAAGIAALHDDVDELAGEELERARKVRERVRRRYRVNPDPVEELEP